MWFGEATAGISFVGVSQALYLIVMSPWVLALASASRGQQGVGGFCQPARDGVGLEQGWGGEEPQIWGEGWSPTCGKWRQDLGNFFIREPMWASKGVIPSRSCIFETTCFSSHLPSALRGTPPSFFYISRLTLPMPEGSGWERIVSETKQNYFFLFFFF